MGKTTVILNPIAGRGAGSRLAADIAATLRQEGLDFDLVSTERPHHATELAREAARQGAGVVIAVGGDGTVHEVLNGLLPASPGADGVGLGVLPIGTGNDFAYGAGLPLDWRQAARVVARGQSRILDVDRVQADDEAPLYFGNGVGIGFDAIVNIESRKIKRLRGFLVYLVAVFKTLAVYYAAPQTTVCVDERELAQPSLMISVMNGRRIGSGFYTTPDARMDDGRLDVCIAGKVGRLRMVGFVPQFMRGSHVGDRKVTMAGGQRIAVVSEMPWASHVDGEIYGVGARRFEIELLPRRLRLLC
jgi:diacylglycerol kinase (ATP)